MSQATLLQRNALTTSANLAHPGGTSLLVALRPVNQFQPSPALTVLLGGNPPPRTARASHPWLLHHLPKRANLPSASSLVNARARLLVTRHHSMVAKWPLMAILELVLASKALGRVTSVKLYE